MENESHIPLGGTINECERQRIIGYSCLSAQKNKKYAGLGEAIG